MDGRIIGIDYGAKNVGIALSDLLHITAQPHKVCDRKIIFDVLRKLMSEERVEKIVLGLPVNMDGAEGQKAKEVRKFAEQIKEQFPVEVEFYDERLSTRSVERMLVEEADMSRSKRKKIKDKLAATVILQGYLDMAR